MRICCLKSQYKKCFPVGSKYFLSDMKEWENVMEYKEYFSSHKTQGGVGRLTVVQMGRRRGWLKLTINEILSARPQSSDDLNSNVGLAGVSPPPISFGHGWVFFCHFPGRCSGWWWVATINKLVGGRRPYPQLAKPPTRALTELKTPTRVRKTVKKFFSFN